MARTIRALFEDGEHVERALGALRSAAFDDSGITVAAPGAPVPAASPAPTDDAAAHHGRLHWLNAHLPGHGSAHARAPHPHALSVAGPQVLGITVATAAEEQDVRTLLVTTGAVEISDPRDGSMKRITPV